MSIPKAISLMGTHRIGKTTLAKTYAEYVDIDFVPMSVSPAYEACGFSMDTQLSMNACMTLQEEAFTIYVRTLEEQESKNRKYITDRCFLDLIGYALADYRNIPSYKTDCWIEDYIKRCTEMNEKYFCKIFLVRPGINIIEDATSWSGDYGSINKVDSCMLWAADHYNYKRAMCKVRYIPQDTLKLIDRINYIYAKELL